MPSNSKKPSAQKAQKTGSNGAGQKKSKDLQTFVISGEDSLGFQLRGDKDPQEGRGHDYMATISLPAEPDGQVVLQLCLPDGVYPVESARRLAWSLGDLLGVHQVAVIAVPAEPAGRRFDPFDDHDDETQTVTRAAKRLIQ